MGQTAERGGLDLRDVLGHGILDCHEGRAGRVEDLLLEARPRPDGTLELVLTHLASGPLAGPMPGWLRVLARLGYRILGIPDPRPALVPWADVAYLDVAVHLDLTRREAGVDQVERAVAHWMERLPHA